jgi:hypothetical protein
MSPPGLGKQLDAIRVGRGYRVKGATAQRVRDLGTGG